MDVSQKEGSDPDFVWEEYLEDTNSEPVPHIAFTHVEFSIESSFKVGMKLEVPSSKDGSTYWIASVIMTCGELLSLRYAGYGDDRSSDFWFKIKSGEFHPVGWCKANGKTLAPPKEILDKFGDIDKLLLEELKNIESIPSSLSEDLGNGFIPIDQIKCGMKLEVKEELNPQNVWIATIMQNVGGRLLLKYDGSSDEANEQFWLFYLSYRLEAVGSAKEDDLEYYPPEAVKKGKTEMEWKKILRNSLKEAQKFPFPSHVLEPRLPVEQHEFKEGMKLEAVNSKNFTDICPATVTKVANIYYFFVTIDSFDKNMPGNVLCCHSNSSFIFPINWAEQNGLQVKPPIGYATAAETFSWNEYLSFCKAEAASSDLFAMNFMNEGFENAMKLEAADPFTSTEIKVATVMQIIEPLMWLSFDSEANKKEFITSIDSLQLYPVGWCASNSFPLHTPSSYTSKLKRVSMTVETKIEEKPSQSVPMPLSSTESQCKSWCPAIYFNYRCFTGPLLSKRRLAELPQGIGPGPLHLVISDVLSKVVNIAYKSCQVLQLLQIHGKPSPAMQQTVIKAKYHNKSYRATIEVIRNSEQVEEFCKKICDKLECCPYLFGPELVGEVCPSNCHTETKTKFGYNYIKKQSKLGSKPSQNPTATPDYNVETIRKGPGRRKKRKHWTHLFQEAVQRSLGKANKSRESSETDEAPKMVVTERKPSKDYEVAKKKFKETPSSNIVTRGAKIPNFGLWYHVSSFHSRRGRPKVKPMHPLTGRKVGRPLGSKKKPVVAQWRSKRIAEKRKLHRAPINYALLDRDDSDDFDDEDDLVVINVEEEEMEHSNDVTPPSSPQETRLKSNPLDWSIDEVVQHIKNTECAPLAPLIREHEIDGQALMMLNIANVQEYLHLKPKPAERFCHLIKDVKMEFMLHFST